jgi:hypothetical protein
MWCSGPESVSAKSNLLDRLVEDGYLVVTWEADKDEMDTMDGTRPLAPTSRTEECYEY